MVGAKMVARFAKESGAIDDAGEMVERMRQAIYRLAESQGEHLKDQDEINRFLELLGAVIASQKGHLMDLHTQNAPERADAWGWERAYDKEGHPYFLAKGDLLGWVADIEKVYLLPDAAFAAVVKLAQAQGEAFSISPRTLWKRMAERGFLLERSADKDKGVGYYRNYSRKMIGGRQLKVLTVFSSGFLNPSDPCDGKNPDKPDKYPSESSNHAVAGLSGPLSGSEDLSGKPDESNGILDMDGTFEWADNFDWPQHPDDDLSGKPDIPEPTGQSKTHKPQGFQSHLSGLSGNSQHINPAAKTNPGGLDGTWGEV